MKRRALQRRRRANPVAAESSFVHEHPFLTFFIVLAGISTVGAVLGART